MERYVPISPFCSFPHQIYSPLLRGYQKFILRSIYLQAEIQFAPRLVVRQSGSIYFPLPSARLRK